MVLSFTLLTLSFFVNKSWTDTLPFSQDPICKPILFIPQAMLRYSKLTLVMHLLFTLEIEKKILDQLFDSL